MWSSPLDSKLHNLTVLISSFSFLSRSNELCIYILGLFKKFFYNPLEKPLKHVIGVEYLNTTTHADYWAVSMTTDETPK